jgi:hypothetical protein
VFACRLRRASVALACAAPPRILTLDVLGVLGPDLGHGEQATGCIIASASLRIGHAAFQVAAEQYPSTRLTVRQSARGGPEVPDKVSSPHRR